MRHPQRHMDNGCVKRKVFNNNNKKEWVLTLTLILTTPSLSLSHTLSLNS